MNKYITTEIITSILTLLIMTLLILKTSFPQDKHITYMHKTLAEYLPGDGWRNVKLGENKSEIAKIEVLLNFDDHLYVENQGLKVFIAYWEPGKMPYDLVGFHCPDVCLIEAGWQKLSNGIFSKNGSIKYVDFKHFVGQQEVHYKHFGYQKDILSRTKRYLTKFTDIFRFGLNSKYDQLVLRIESDRPLEDNDLYVKIKMIIKNN